jgi:hypothetical protein
MAGGINLCIIGFANDDYEPLSPQSSSASRFTADASGFFILSQSGDRPCRATMSESRLAKPHTTGGHEHPQDSR